MILNDLDLSIILSGTSLPAPHAARSSTFLSHQMPVATMGISCWITSTLSINRLLTCGRERGLLRAFRTWHLPLAAALPNFPLFWMARAGLLLASGVGAPFQSVLRLTVEL